ncbi:hypothetical protein AB1E18_008184 [Capra hircus]
MPLSSLLWVFLAFTFSGYSVAQQVTQVQTAVPSQVGQTVTLNCRYEEQADSPTLPDEEEEGDAAHSTSVNLMDANTTMRLVTGVTVLLTLGIMVDVEITQLSSMDCAEGEDVNLPCNHSTIDALDYIHWYRQTPNQSPQYVIHGFRDTVNSSMSSLNIASDRKSSTLVLSQVTLRDTAVYYCVLREAHWDRWGCTCAVSLWWEEGGDTVGEQA